MEGSVLPNANRPTLEYLIKVLSGLPFEKSPLLLNRLTLTLGFQDLRHTAVHACLERARPWLRLVEDKLLGWVKQQKLKGVRIELAQCWREEETLDASFISEFLPRLHSAGVLSL